MCAESGLDVVAITDHDLSPDLPVGPQTFGDRTIHVVAGAEVSGVHEGREYHLLVYFPGAVPAAFRDFCVSRSRHRADRYEAAVQSIDLPGLELPDDAARSGERALTRHHLARALIEAGHATDLRDAFRRFAADGHGHVPQVNLSFVDAIRVARSFGGITSWAHPCCRDLTDHLADFVDAGLQGIEGYRPRQPDKNRKHIRKLAKRYGLFITGGSDWHGWTGDAGLFYVQPAQLEAFLAALKDAA